MSRLDALLINPVSAKMAPAFIPHGLLYIGAYALEQGYSVDIYDRNVESKDVAEIIQKTSPRVVGLGCLTGSAIDDAIYVCEQIRKVDPSIKIVWGGIHTTLYPDIVLRNDFVDFVVCGDGEIAFSKILDNVMNSNMHLESIDNLGYKDAQDLKYNKRSFVDLNNVPLPAWHLIKVENYIRKKFYANRVLTINTSRGCPYKCSFCCVPTVHRGSWRAMSAERIFTQLKYLSDNYNIDGFQVDDDEFDIDRARVLKLCDLFKENNANFKWSHFSRVNIVKEEVLAKEIDCGLSLIEFGLESGSRRMLKFLNKNQTLEQIHKAYSICKNLGLRTSALFMVGLPTESEQEVKQTAKLVKRLKPHLAICTLYRPYPGTELFDYCMDKGLFNYESNLREASKVYDKLINTSQIKTKVLLKIKAYFDKYNIYQEIKLILKKFKVGLLFYYFKHYVLKSQKSISKWN